MVYVRCNLCGADDGVVVSVKFDLRVVRCRRCSLVYTNPRPPLDVIWGRYSPQYFEREYLPSWGLSADVFDSDALYRRHLPLLEKLRRYRQTNWLLDVGAGAGLFLHTAQRDGWQVQGVEIASGGIEFARSRLGLNVLQGSITKVALPDQRYDVVTLQETIEHLLDPFTDLKEIFRVLRPGGVLSLTTPNFNSLTHMLIGREWSVLSPGEHLFYFTTQTLQTMLERAGFVSIRVCATGDLMPDQVHKRTRRVRFAQYLLHKLRRCHRQVERLALGDTLVATAERSKI